MIPSSVVLALLTCLAGILILASSLIQLFAQPVQPFLDLHFYLRLAGWALLGGVFIQIVALMLGLV